MADRKAKTTKISEDPKEVVELDKDERWQARLEEARARREVALREKAAAPRKKQRRKPWEEEPGDDPDDFEIKPIIQDKPESEKDVDLADRLEAAKAAKPKPVPEPVPEIEPEIAQEPEPEPEPEPTPRVVPQFRSKARSFDEIMPPDEAPTVAPAPLPKRKKRRENKLVAPGAPDVIDLAQRYASTLKPPVNVTEPFDTVPREVVSTPPPGPMVMPVRRARTRRPFGLGLIVLAFSLVPLAQMAPPLEKGPEQPASPYFGLPPALGLTTSMVWPVAPTQSGEWLAPPPPAALGAVPRFEASPLKDVGPIIGLVPGLGAAPEAAMSGGLNWSLGASPLPLPPLAPLVAAPAPDAPGEPLEVPVPRPRPIAPELESEAPLTPAPAPTPLTEPVTGPNNGTVVERSQPPRGPELTEIAAPDARPRPAAPTPVAPPASPLKVTILVPAASDPAAAEEIAQDTQARGHELTRIQQVNLSISEPNVRYFYDEDRAEAERLAKAYGAEVKDFTWFKPAPERGTTEIWLSGSGGRAPAPRAPEVRTVEEVPQAPPRTITVIRKEPTFLERLLTGADTEIEIIVPNPSAILNDAQGAGAGQN